MLFLIVLHYIILAVFYTIGGFAVCWPNRLTEYKKGWTPPSLPQTFDRHLRSDKSLDFLKNHNIDKD